MNHNNQTNHINHSSDSVRISELWFTTDFCDWNDFIKLPERLIMINDDKSSVKIYIQKHHMMNHNNQTNHINHSSDNVRIS